MHDRLDPHRNQYGYQNTCYTSGALGSFVRVPQLLEHRRFMLSAPILPFSHLLRNRMKHIFLCVRHLCTYIHVVLQIQVDAGASARDRLDTYLTTYGYLGF